MSESTLQLLLDHLRRLQNCCPYCGGEYVHGTYADVECILKGLWFPEESENKSE